MLISHFDVIWGLLLNKLTATRDPSRNNKETLNSNCSNILPNYAFSGFPLRFPAIRTSQQPTSSLDQSGLIKWGCKFLLSFWKIRWNTFGVIYTPSFSFNRSQVMTNTKCTQLVEHTLATNKTAPHKVISGRFVEFGFCCLLTNSTIFVSATILIEISRQKESVVECSL